MGPSAAVIGIGINVYLEPDVRQRIDQAVADLAATGVRIDRLLGTCLAHLADVLPEFAANGFGRLRPSGRRPTRWPAAPLPSRSPTAARRPVSRRAWPTTVRCCRPTAACGASYSGEVSVRPAQRVAQRLTSAGGRYNRPALRQLPAPHPSMILAIDAGNTRIKWGLWEDRGRRAGLHPRAAELPDALHMLPRAEFAIGRTLPARRCGIEAALALAPAGELDRQHGLAVRCDQPVRESAQLGTDRWAALVGARARAAARASWSTRGLP